MTEGLSQWNMPAQLTTQAVCVCVCVCAGLPLTADHLQRLTCHKHGASVCCALAMVCCCEVSAVLLIVQVSCLKVILNVCLGKIPSKQLGTHCTPHAAALFAVSHSLPSHWLCCDRVYGCHSGLAAWQQATKVP